MYQNKSTVYFPFSRIQPAARLQIFNEHLLTTLKGNASRYEGQIIPTVSTTARVLIELTNQLS